MEGGVPTVTGQTVAENVARAPVRDNSVIRPMEDPYAAVGGLAILFGSLAPDGAVVKQARNATAHRAGTDL